MTPEEKDNVWQRILSEGYPRPPDNRRAPKD